MKQRFCAKLAICVLTVLSVSSAFAFQGPQPFSADFTTTSANGNLNMAGKIYFSMPRMRMDMNSPAGAKAAGPFGGKMSMIVDTTAKMMYMLMTEQHMYMEFSTQQNSTMTQRMPKFDDLFRGNDPCAGREGATCTKLGTETVNGRSCDKWQITPKNGQQETFWMDQKLHFPVKMVVGDITTQYTNIQEGAQAPSLFTVPPGYQKFDASAMGARPH